MTLVSGSFVPDAAQGPLTKVHQLRSSSPKTAMRCSLGGLARPVTQMNYVGTTIYLHQVGGSEDS